MSPDNTPNITTLPTSCFMSAALPVLDLSGDLFWSESQSQVVAALIDEARTETARTVRAKVAAAEQRLAYLTAALPAGPAAAVLAALSGRPMSSGEHDEPQECPVCRQMGWLICGVEPGLYESYFDEETGTSGGYQLRYAYPSSFECPVCLLELDFEEMAEFHFPSKIELDPTEVREEDYEPDEDESRGR